MKSQSRTARTAERVSAGSPETTEIFTGLPPVRGTITCKTTSSFSLAPSGSLGATNRKRKPRSTPSLTQTRPFTGCKVHGGTRSAVCERLSCPKAIVEANSKKTTLDNARIIARILIQRSPNHGFVANGRLPSEAGGPALCAICAEGAWSLRFLQGRVAMVPTQLFVPSAQTALLTRAWFPPFANCAKDGAPSCIGHAGKIKSRATRQLLCRLYEVQRSFSRAKNARLQDDKSKSKPGGPVHLGRRTGEGARLHIFTRRNFASGAPAAVGMTRVVLWRCALS
jgi:hypothetical protein